MGIGILLGGHCLLRTGELVELAFSQIEWAEDYASCVISLGTTKGGARRGVLESVTVELQWLSLAMRALREAPNATPTVVGVPSHVFRRVFNEGIAALKCDGWGFMPYSIRRGGATDLWRTSGALSKVTLRGRWQQASTARIYVNDGLAVLAEQKLPKEPSRSLSDAFCKRFSIDKVLFCKA